MERHDESRVISIFRKQFNTDFDVDIAFPVVHFPEFPHLASLRKTQVFYCLHVFFNSQPLKLPLQRGDRILIGESICYSKLICVSLFSVEINLTLLLEGQPGTMLKGVPQILQIRTNLQLTFDS